MNDELQKRIIRCLSYYYGKTQTELKQIFSIDSSAKNINEVLLKKMLGTDEKLISSDEIKASGIKLKTIRIQKNGHIKESMSFPTFKFKEIIHQEWEKSDFYRILNSSLFMFVIFNENQDGEFTFSRVKFWHISEKDLFEASKAWKATAQIIRDGVQLEFDGKVMRNNLPNSKDNSVVHVRPHARNSQDTYPLPDGREMPKQCFWLNRSYIERIVTDDTEKQLSFQEPLNDNEKSFVQCLLNNTDLVFISDIEEAYILKFGREHVNRINSESLNELGYMYCSDHAISFKYKDEKDYYSHLILQHSLFDVANLDVRLIQSLSFNSVLNSLRSNYDILEYEEGKYITFEHIAETTTQITKNTFLGYVSDAIRFTGDNRYFNSKSLRKTGYNHQLYNLGFTDFFYDRILCYSGNLKYIFLGGNIIFYINNNLEVASSGNFIKWLLKDKRKMSIVNMKNQIESIYGILISENTIISIVTNIGLYYDSTMEKIYLTKEDFYNEL